MQQHPTLSISRREALAFGLAGATAGVVAPYIFATPKWRTTPQITGRGGHEYEIIHDWLTAPSGMAFGDTHGLTQDATGRIYLCHTVHSSSGSDHAVCVFDNEGTFIESWGGAFRGGAHGLDIREEDGQEFLYHCDTRRSLVVKTDLKGEVLWELSRPEGDDYAGERRYVPTNVAFAPDGDFFVGDGYGSSYIHRYDREGKLVAHHRHAGSRAGTGGVPTRAVAWMIDSINHDSPSPIDPTRGFNTSRSKASTSSL